MLCFLSEDSGLSVVDKMSRSAFGFWGWLRAFGFEDYGLGFGLRVEDLGLGFREGSLVRSG